jgi:hypothetical protein
VRQSHADALQRGANEILTALCRSPAFGPDPLGSTPQHPSAPTPKTMTTPAVKNEFTCPKCGHTFVPPLARFLPFTQEQYRQVVATHGEDFQICPKCKNVFGPRSGTKTGCFIATAVYGDENVPEVLFLRQFRDEVLAQSRLGRAAVGVYYKLSPYGARWVKRSGWRRRMARRLLDLLILKLEHRMRSGSRSKS